jgi:cell division GTPase FtsZ
MPVLGLFRKKEKGAVAGTLAVGVGGGGCNIVNRLGTISGVDILTVNTDRKGLIRSRSNRRILLGDGSMTEGCDGNAETGRTLAKKASSMIQESIKRHLNIVIMAGLGGGTGTGSAEVIAELAKRNGSRVIVMATMPMSFESGRRNIAADALDGIMRSSDILLVMDGDRLVEIDPMLGVREAFSVLDQMMCESFMGIMEMLEGDNGESMFQTMRGKMFTVSFAEGMHIDKVANALVNGLMMDAAVVSPPVIFIRGNIPQDGSEGTISDRIYEGTGKAPVFVQGPSGHGMRLMMFAPIQ